MRSRRAIADMAGARIAALLQASSAPSSGQFKAVLDWAKTFIETAEASFAPKKKSVSPDDEQFDKMDSGSVTAALGNRVAALELAMRKQNDVLQKILAATAAK